MQKRYSRTRDERDHLLGSTFRRGDAVRRILHADLVQNGGFALAAIVVVNAGNYFFQAYASRRLGVAEFGVVTALLALGNLLTIPLSIVLIVITRFAAEYHAVHDSGRLRRLVHVFTLVCVSLGIGVTAAVILASTVLGDALNIDNRSAIVAAAVFTGGSSILPAFRGALQGVQDFRGMFVTNVVEGVSRAGFGIGGILLGFGAAGAVWGLALAMLPTIGISLALVLPHIDAEPVQLRLKPRRLVAAVSGIATSTTCILVLTGVDVLFVKHFFPPQIAGLYGAVNLIGRIVFFALSFAPQIVLPAAAALSRRGASTTSLLFRTLLAATAMGACAITVTAIFPALLLRLVVGTEYVGAAPYLTAYVASMVLLSLANVVVSCKIAIHDFRFLWMLVPMTCVELVAFVSLHHSIGQMIGILLVTGTLVLFSSLALSLLLPNQPLEMVPENIRPQEKGAQ